MVVIEGLNLTSKLPCPRALKSSANTTRKAGFSKYSRLKIRTYLDQLGFTTAGYGCMTCIGNAGELDVEVSDAITKGDLAAAAVLSGNRNFEARVHALVKANYLASPPLVVAYALAGRVDIDFDLEPIGKDKNGKEVFLRDLWPNRDFVTSVVEKNLKADMFKSVYAKLQQGGNKRWNDLKTDDGKTY